MNIFGYGYTFLGISAGISANPDDVEGPFSTFLVKETASQCKKGTVFTKRFQCEASLAPLFSKLLPIIIQPMHLCVCFFKQRYMVNFGDY